MTALLLLLVTARLLGEFAERRGQPSMVGEILAGLLLGPSVLGWVEVTPELRTISDLGIFLLVLLAGMEIDPAKLADTAKGRRWAVAVMSFFLPLALGMAVAALFGLDRMRILFVGLCVAITALPVAARMLLDAGMLHTEVGRQILSAAVANDVLALLVLGVILDVTQSEPGWFSLMRSIGWTSLKAVGFMALLVGAYRAVERAAGWLASSNKSFDERLASVRGKESAFALTILFVLVFASVSESIGLHFVVGAFFGAMLLSRKLLGRASFDRIQKTTSGVTVGFLAPIFFATLGLEFELVALKRYGLLLAVLVAAFVGKIAGGYLGGRAAGFSAAESWLLGYGLNGRGIMELVIADIALKNGFIGQGLFSILVMMGLVTTIATPILLRRGRAAALARA